MRMSDGMSLLLPPPLTLDHNTLQVRMVSVVLDVGVTLVIINYLLNPIPVFNGVPSSCFPSSTGLGSSFDVDLAHQVGEALAEEARAKGAVPVH